MGPEVSMKEKSKEKMKASISKANWIFAKQLEDELIESTISSEETEAGGQLVEQTQKIHKNADVEVEVMECLKNEDNDVVEAQRSDSTECSSSFDNSDYEVESETLSEFHGDAVSAPEFDGLGKIFRTRKVSSHWRAFIHPLMWRCKWVELQIKKLNAQAEKYDRKLQECNPETSEIHTRKKRRQAEETEDVAAYMSRHNLFSYYENRKHLREVAHRVLKNPENASRKVNIDNVDWSNDELLHIDAGNDDNFLEQILRKIDLLQSQVGKMKSRLNKVTSENAIKFSCIYDSSLPILNHSIISPPNTDAPPRNGYRMPVGTYIASQLMSEYNMGGLLLPESATESHGEGVADANGSRNDAHFGYEYGNGDDEILMDNRRVTEEMPYLKEVKIRSFQRPSVLRDGLCAASPLVPVESNLLTDNQRLPEIRSISNLIDSPRRRSARGRIRKRALQLDESIHYFSY